MTTVVFDGKYLAADGRATGPDGNATADDRVKIHTFGKDVVYLDKTKSKVLLAIAFSGLVREFDAFLHLVIDFKSLEYALLGVGYQIKKPEFTGIVLFTDGTAATLNWDESVYPAPTKNTIVNAHALKLKFIEIADPITVLGTGGIIATFFSKHLHDGLVANAMELCAVTSAFDGHTGGTISYISAKKPVIQRYKGITKTKLNRCIKAFSSALITHCKTVR